MIERMVAIDNLKIYDINIGNSDSDLVNYNHQVPFGGYKMSGQVCVGTLLKSSIQNTQKKLVNKRK